MFCLTELATVNQCHVAAFALHAVVALKHDSNADLASDSSSGVMSFEEFAESLGVNLDSLPASESESMTASASGPWSMEFETTEDAITYVINIVDKWAASESKIMGDWAKPNSVEFKNFQKKMNKLNALVADVKEMSGSGSGSNTDNALESLLDEVWKEIRNIKTLVNDVVRNAPADDSSLSLEKYQEIMAITELEAATEGSNKWPITLTSVDSATQSSPLAQKTKNKQTESEPAEKSTK